MKVDKLTVSLDPELGDAIRSAAARAGNPLPAWLAEAAASKLRTEGLDELLASWEAEHGALSAAEVSRAERELGCTLVNPPREVEETGSSPAIQVTYGASPRRPSTRR